MHFADLLLQRICKHTLNLLIQLNIYKNSSRIIKVKLLIFKEALNNSFLSF